MCFGQCNIPKKTERIAIFQLKYYKNASVPYLSMCTLQCVSLSNPLAWISVIVEIQLSADTLVFAVTYNSWC